MISNRGFNFFLAALSLLLLVSCGNKSAQSTQDQKAKLCTDLARFDTAVATLKSMSPNSTVGDFKKADAQVRATYSDVTKSAQKVQDAKTADLERAYNNLDKAIRSIPNTATLRQAGASISGKVAAVQAAEAQMRSNVSCT